MTDCGYKDRKAIYEQIEKERGSKVINYVTGDRPGMETQISPDVIDLFVDHLDELWPIERLTLILYTSGGDTATAWRLINLLRTFCEELEILVISKAHSAGTLMCLGANRIVMTKQATLSPIDPSLSHPLNPQVPGGAPNHRVTVSVEAVQGYLDVAKERLDIQHPELLIQVLTHLSSQIHPLVLGQIFRTRNQIRFLAESLLRNQHIEEGKKEKIISFLCSDSGSHDHTINRREAKELGLVIDKPSGKFYPALKALQKSIRNTLLLRNIFIPDIEVVNGSQRDYSFRRSMIESVPHGCHHFVSEGRLEKIDVLADPAGQESVPGIQAHNMPGIQDRRTFEGWRKEA